MKLFLFQGRQGRQRSRSSGNCRRSHVQSHLHRLGRAQASAAQKDYSARVGRIRHSTQQAAAQHWIASEGEGWHQLAVARASDRVGFGHCQEHFGRIPHPQCRRNVALRRQRRRFDRRHRRQSRLHPLHLPAQQNRFVNFPLFFILLLSID